MEDTSRAFNFVDRISVLEAGVRIRGHYAIPAGLEAFPASLAAEAVGQLAAWAAMAAVGFERRPVAGLAENIELNAPPRPGQILELAAELESVDGEAVAYGGTAQADGISILRLQHCVGPMVAVEEFDSPERLRERFNRLCGPGEPPGGFDGLPSLPLEHLDGESGRCARAILHVPAAAPLFFEHFPRRHVFPGSLLMHMNLQLAARLASRLPRPAKGGPWTPRGVSGVKLRAFIPPGEKLALEAKLDSVSDHTATIVVETRVAKRIVGGARVRLAPEERP